MTMISFRFDGEHDLGCKLNSRDSCPPRRAIRNAFPPLCFSWGNGCNAILRKTGRFLRKIPTKNLRARWVYKKGARRPDVFLRQ